MIVFSSNTPDESSLYWRRSVVVVQTSRTTATLTDFIHFWQNIWLKKFCEHLRLVYVRYCNMGFVASRLHVKRFTKNKDIALQKLMYKQIKHARFFYKNQSILQRLIILNFLAASASICSYFCERFEITRNQKKTETRHWKTRLIVSLYEEISVHISKINKKLLILHVRVHIILDNSRYW